MWVNRTRIPAEKAHQLSRGDSIQFGVPVIGNEVEFDYVFIQKPFKDIEKNLAKKSPEASCPRKPKRKLPAEEVEPSTSKPKLYRCSSADKSGLKPCPLSPAKHQQTHSHSQPAESRPSDSSSTSCDVDNLQT